MGHSLRKPSLANRLMCGFLLLTSVSSVGCTVQVGGQTLPSGYYLSDDVQYFAPGPEFYLQNEATAQALRKAQAEAQKAERQANGGR
jgi:hypothetical protein